MKWFRVIADAALAALWVLTCHLWERDGDGTAWWAAGMAALFGALLGWDGRALLEGDS